MAMAGWDGRLSDTEIWNIINYLRALAAHETIAAAAAPTAAAAPRPILELTDYAPMPITGDTAGENTRGQLARVNFMRDEPGGRRFFVNAKAKF